MKKMKFKITGEYLTDLLRNFIIEGRFATVYGELTQLPDDVIKGFFNFQYKFIGNTEMGGELSCIQDDTEITDEQLMTAIRTMLSEKKLEWSDFLKLQDEDIAIFEKMYCSKQEFIHKNLETIFAELHFGYDYTSEIQDMSTGVILENGMFIHCNYGCHSGLYHELFELKLGLVDNYDWVDCKKTIHVSSGTLGGDLVHSALVNPDLYKKRLTPQQFDTICKHAHHWDIYGHNKSTLSSVCLFYHNHILSKGGKYNNLMFLEKYTDIKTPKIHLERPKVNINQYCIRTSPKHSMAGVLDSIFKIEQDSEQKIFEKFEQHKNLIKDNELTIFYQEYLEGINGVAHHSKNGFSYQASDKQGDIVNGKKGTVTLGSLAKGKLEQWAENLYKMFRQLVQLEFVLTPQGELYIVQMRLFNEPKNGKNLLIEQQDIVIKGLSFYPSKAENLSIDDILITDCDLPSDQLIGKKALVVIDQPEFSHLLALSQALKIPSMTVNGITKEDLINQLIDKDLSIYTETKDAYLYTTK